MWCGSVRCLVAVGAPKGTGHSGGDCSSGHYPIETGGAAGWRIAFYSPPQHLQCGDPGNRNVGSHGCEGMVWVLFLPTHSCRGCGLCEEVMGPYLVDVCPTEGQLEAQIRTSSSHTRLNANTLRMEFMCFP